MIINTLFLIQNQAKYALVARLTSDKGTASTMGGSIPIEEQHKTNPIRGRLQRVHYIATEVNAVVIRITVHPSLPIMVEIMNQMMMLMMQSHLVGLILLLSVSAEMSLI